MKANEILEAFDVVDEEASSYLATCPVHKAGKEERPSLVITFNGDAKTALIICRVCGKGRTPDILVAAGLTMRDLFDVSYIGQVMRGTSPRQRKPMEADPRRAANAAAFKHARDLQALDADHWARAYVLDRFGIDAGETTVAELHDLGIGYSADRARVAFALRTTDGRYAFGQYRRHPDATDETAPGKYISDHRADHRGDDVPDDGAAWDAVGIAGQLDKSRRDVVIVEGVSDALTLAKHGPWNAACGRGSGMGGHVHEIQEALAGSVVYVVGDGDEAGQTYVRDVAEHASAYASDVRVVSVPAGSDVNDLYRADPAAFVNAFQKRLDHAEPYRRKVDYFVDLERVKTDAMRARETLRYLRAEGFDVKYAAGNWYYWDGYAWRDQGNKGAAITQAAHRLGAHIADKARGLQIKALETARQTGNTPDETLFKAMMAASRPFLTIQHVRSMLESLSTNRDVVTSPDAFDANPDVIAARNGLVNLRTGSIRPVVASDMVSKRLEHDYNPAAVSSRFAAFMREVCVDYDGQHDPQLARWLQVAFGYGLTGHISEEMMVLLAGAGGNGKSKMLAAIRNAVGPLLVDSSPRTFGKRNGEHDQDRARLAGARYIIVPEANKMPLDEAFVKALTGGDAVQANKMRENSFSYVSRGLLILTANQKPNVSGQDDGIWRRVKLVPLLADFRSADKRDTHLEAKLNADAEYVLAWLVEGAKAWYADGLPPSQAITRETDAYRRESDVLGDFMAENILYTNVKQDHVLLHDLWQRYGDWCELRQTERALKERAFKLAIPERVPVIATSHSIPKRVRYHRLLSPSEVQARMRAELREALESDGVDEQSIAQSVERIQKPNFMTPWQQVRESDPARKRGIAPPVNQEEYTRQEGEPMRPAVPNVFAPRAGDAVAEAERIVQASLEDRDL